MSLIHHNIMAGESKDWRIQIFLTTNENNVNIHTKAQAVYGGTITRPYRAVVTVADGVIIGSTSTANPAMDFNSMPANSSAELYVGNGSYIVGRGGNGGNQNGAGNAGGDAIRTNVPLYLSGHSNATIGGGAGGGSGGRRAQNNYLITQYQAFGNGQQLQENCSVMGSFGETTFGTGGAGGGGAGDDIGQLGSGQTSGATSATLTTGGAGGTSSGAPGSSYPDNGPCTNQTGFILDATDVQLQSSTSATSSAAGGNLGFAGGTGTYGGGAAGRYINGSSFLILTNKWSGTLLGGAV